MIIRNKGYRLLAAAICMAAVSPELPDSTPAGDRARGRAEHSARRQACVPVVGAHGGHTNCSRQQAVTFISNNHNDLTSN